MTIRLDKPVISSICWSDGHAVNEVTEADLTGHLGDDRMGMRIPVGHHLTRQTGITIIAQRKSRTVRHFVTFSFTPTRSITPISPERETATSLPCVCLTSLDVVQTDRTGRFHCNAVVRRSTACGTTDMEGTHGQLSARLTDGLRRNNTDSLTDVDPMTARQVTTVAMLRTHRNGFRR